MNQFFSMKIISSLEKCFFDETLAQKPALESASMLKNERYSFCAGIELSPESEMSNPHFFMRVKTDLCADVKAFRVDHVPVKMPLYHNNRDDNYLRDTPGLYPDLLMPIDETSELGIIPHSLKSLWFTIVPHAQQKGGDYSVTIELFDKDQNVLATASLPVHVVDAQLPESEMLYTQWFYTDCLAQYYNVPVFSDRHFEIIENFIAAAEYYGINQILTPVFTPPLDTAEGGERLTTQLIGIEKDAAGYRFDYTLLDRWIDICERHHMRRYEIAHFFTQWGALHAPKIVAKVNGEEKRIFGWDTDACSPEYIGFLHALIPQMIAHFAERGIGKDRLAFHISDEPSLDHLENYCSAKNAISDCLEGCTVCDAMSNYEFFEKGYVDTPICANNCIEPFIGHHVENLWTYYCCGQVKEVSNRYLSMPSARNRIIATAFYKYHIAGFLHWGFNFYNSVFSTYAVNPYLTTEADYFAPAGDPHCVYPAPDGTAFPSLRIVVFYDALQDVRAMRLCESLTSYEEVMQLMQEGVPEEITFKSYPRDAEYILQLREKVNRLIEQKLSENK